MTYLNKHAGKENNQIDLSQVSYLVHILLSSWTLRTLDLAPLSLSVDESAPLPSPGGGRQKGTYPVYVLWLEGEV